MIAEVLSELPQSSILVAAQATGFASRDFDAVDTVIKPDGVAVVELGD